MTELHEYAQMLRRDLENTGAGDEYPGLDGIPFRTSFKGQAPPTIRDQDAELRRVNEVQAAVFDLSDAEQLKAYNDLFRRVGLKEIMISTEQINWVAESRSYVTFVRWYKPYLVSSKSGRPETGARVTGENDGSRVFL